MSPDHLQQENAAFDDTCIFQQSFDVASWNDFLPGWADLSTFSMTPSPIDNLWTAVDNNNMVLPAGDAGNTSEYQSYTLEEEDALMSDHVNHIPNVPAETHARILSFAKGRLGNRADVFPSLLHLDVYAQLYFEHFHPRMPFLHKPTFSTDEEAWFLVLAVAAMGCQYSTAPQSRSHLDLFLALAHRIIQQDVSDPVHYVRNAPLTFSSSQELRTYCAGPVDNFPSPVDILQSTSIHRWT